MFERPELDRKKTIEEISYCIIYGKDVEEGL